MAKPKAIGRAWVVLMLLAMLVPAIDLATGWPLGTREYDILVLAVLGLSAWSTASAEWLARRVRPTDERRFIAVVSWLEAVASVILFGAIGYFFAGWRGAVLCVTAVVLGGTALVLLALLRRRHRADTRS